MVTPLIAPRHGVPEVVNNESDFEKLIAQLLNGSGPLAIDAERACPVIKWKWAISNRC